MASRGKRGKQQFGDNGFGEWGGYMAAKKARLGGGKENFRFQKKQI